MKSCPGQSIAFTRTSAFHKHADHLLVLLDAVNRVITASGALMLEWMGVSLFILRERAVKVLLEDWLNFDLLELGLEVFGALEVGGGVGATTWVRHVDVADVIDLVSWMAPGGNG